MASYASAGGVNSWHNQTFALNGYFGGENYSVQFAAAAYNPDLQEVVVYGGCAYGDCPSNQTWAYSGYEWFNYTGFTGATPPSLYAEGLTWDPAYGEVILDGGILPNGSASNQTWEYGADGWENLTSSVNSRDFFQGIGTSWAATAFDSALNELIVVDGCADSSCSSIWQNTDGLADHGWTVLGTGPAAGGNSSSNMWGATMAYDRVDRELVYFGGMTGEPGRSENWTFVYNGTGWSNITSTAASCFGGFGCYYPTDRYGASETWDGQIEEIVLTGGYSSSENAYLNDTWYFDSGVWYPSSGTQGSISGPTPGYGAAMPTNSSDVSPIQFGGGTNTSFFNTSWVLEIPPAPEILGVTPNPVDAGAVVNLTAQHTVGAGSGPFLDAYGGVGLTLIFSGLEGGMNFTTPYSFGFNSTTKNIGTEELWAKEFDFFQIEGSSYANVSVAPNVTADPFAGPSPTEVGTPTVFMANATLGTPGYSYLWGFGDGSPESTLENPSHTYSEPGDLVAWVNVTDEGGGWTNQTVAITIYPELTVVAVPNVIATDVGVKVNFTAVPTGGAPGTDTYDWQFGDSTDGTGPAAAHAYSRPGTFEVNVTVKDSLGFTAVAQANVTVNPALFVSTIYASPSAPAAGMTVSFNATVAHGTPPLTYAWSVDGTSSGSGTILIHAFPSAGAYAVELTVTDGAGVRISSSITINVTSSRTPGLLTVLTTGDGPLYLVGLAVAAVALAVGLYGIRRKKRRGSTRVARPDPGASTGPQTSQFPEGR